MQTSFNSTSFINFDDGAANPVVNTSVAGGNKATLDLKAPMMDGMRMKMLKRYQQKSKAANVLLNIGYPQKKYKLNAELGKIQKVVAGKMEEETKQFFELLNETSMSFFR